VQALDFGRPDSYIHLRRKSLALPSITTFNSSSQGNTMNRILLSTLVAISSIAGVNAHAESSTPAPAFEATADRAQVLAELESFRALPNNPWSPAHDPLRNFSSERSRAEVTAEYLSSRDDVAAMTREDSGSQALAQGSVTPEGEVVGAWSDATAQ
jgi:hypothetical protein